MIGTLASAGATVFGGVWNAYQAHKTAKANEAALENEEARNNAYYNRNYYADATQLADNRRILSEGMVNFRRANQAQAGIAAVMGGTNAQAAATKEANAQAYANTAARVAANAQNYKQHVQDQYMKQADVVQQRQIELDQQRNAANAQAMKDAVSAVGIIAPEADKAWDAYKARNEEKKKAKENNEA